MLSKRVETGVQVMKDGKAWGIKYQDGQSTEYGWMDPALAPIHDPKYCINPTDVTYRGSYYREEVKTGKLVSVIRTTIVEAA